MDQIFLGRVNVRSWPNPNQSLKNSASLLHPFSFAAVSAVTIAAANIAHLDHLVGKGDSETHKRRFDEIVAALVPYSRDYLSSIHKGNFDDGDKSVRVALDRGIMACVSGEGQAFALDPKDRWLALMVPDGQSPREAARTMQEFLCALVDDQGLRIDVDLVCQPGAVLEGLGSLPSIAELEVTIRLPNDPAKSLKDAIRQMEKIGATEKVDSFRSGRGLWVSKERAEVLDAEASVGNADVRARSLTDVVFDSRDTVARFTPPFKVSADLVPLSLVLAILWVIQNWPPSGGGQS